MSDVLISQALVLNERWLDTDQIVPARFCTVGRPSGLSDALFHDLRARGDLKIQVPLPASRRILVAGEGFGTGSGREHAVWALQDAGAAAIIAPSFGTTFQRGAILNGLWPVVLAPEHHQQLIHMIMEHRDLLVQVDAFQRRVEVSACGRWWPIHWSEAEAAQALAGADPLAELLELLPVIEAFEKARPGSPDTNARSG